MAEIELDDDLFAEGDTLKDRYLTFYIGEETYGIEIRFVTEIVGVQQITEVPDMPSFVKGVINLRGQVIPIIDVRLRFHMEEREYDERTCVIVVNINDTTIGLVVDRVEEVREISEDDVSPPPMTSSAGAARYILGMGKVGDDVKILLDVSKLLFEEELDQIASA